MLAVFDLQINIDNDVFIILNTGINLKNNTINNDYNYALNNICTMLKSKGFIDFLVFNLIVK